MKNIHSVTLEFVRQILNKFKYTNDEMKATTIDLLYNIKKAYFKFLRAHKMMEVVKKRPAEMVTV